MIYLKKRSFRYVLRKSFSVNMQQIYSRTPVSKCTFNKVAKQIFEIAHWHGCSPVNLFHIFRTLFPKNTSGELLLYL